MIHLLTLLNLSPWNGVHYTLIPDNAIDVGMINDASEELSDKQNYGCGCFWFKKI